LGHKTDVTALAFVEPFHLLVSADFAGYVACWRIPEPGKKHKYDSMVLTRFINMQSLESSALVNCLHPVYEETSQDDKDNPRGRFTLYTGDEDGDVRVWDLSKLLVEAEIEPSEPRSDWEPHKKGGEMDATHVAEEMAMLAAKDKIPELPIPPDMNPVVQRVRWWKAHTDSIRSLEVYSTPDCVVTAGYDHMVKVWTRIGELMCILGQPNWNFPASDSMAGIGDAQLDSVLARVASLERATKSLSKSRATKTLYSLEREVQPHKARAANA
jgi:WD40 repeat protein